MLGSLITSAVLAHREGFRYEVDHCLRRAQSNHKDLHVVNWRMPELDVNAQEQLENFLLVALGPQAIGHIAEVKVGLHNLTNLVHTRIVVVLHRVLRNVNIVDTGACVPVAIVIARACILAAEVVVIVIARAFVLAAEGVVRRFGDGTALASESPSHWSDSGLVSRCCNCRGTGRGISAACSSRVFIHAPLAMLASVARP